MFKQAEVMTPVRYPSLYQINTRVWLRELSRTLNRPATLDEIPDAELDRLAKMGFDWVWFLSVWQTGTGRSASLAEQSGMAQGISEDPPGSARGGHSRLGLRDHGLHRAL
jgi:hypothetical protein